MLLYMHFKSSRCAQLWRLEIDVIGTHDSFPLTREQRASHVITFATFLYSLGKNMGVFFFHSW
jgi:hypothetical protein